MTPTARTLNDLRRAGWTAEVVERWIAGANIRKDFLGIGDVLAMRIGEPLLLVQCTSAANISARVHKAKAEPRLRTWLQCGHRFEVWGWGKMDGRWRCRIVPLVADELDGIIARMPPRRKRKRQEPCLFG